jgi:hypothetical protein
MRRAISVLWTGWLILGISLGGCGGRRRPTATPISELIGEPTPPVAQHIKDPLSLRLQDVDVTRLREHKQSDPEYPGMAGRYYDLAVERGARTVIVPEYGTYFLYWLPDDWSALEEKRVLAVMHGDDGTAAPRLHDLYEHAFEYGFGLASIQWGWRPSPGEDYRYLDETVEGMKVSYHIMELALEYIDRHHGLEETLSAWNGFGRSSGHSIVYAYLDKASGNNYFQLFMDIAGGLNATMPFVRGVVDGDYGPQPVRDKRFYLWCGTADDLKESPGTDGSSDTVCASQESSQQALVARGGVIAKFSALPDAGHMTWNSEPELQKEAIDIWLQETVIAGSEEPSEVTPTPVTQSIEPTAAVPHTASPLSIESFTVDVEELETGKRLTFTWETTGATEALLVVGTARRFIPWWTVPPNGTHTVVLAETFYRDPKASLTAYDEAGNGISDEVTIVWPCEHEYFFTLAPDECPLYEALYTAAAEQPFERGRMIWLEEIRGEDVLIEKAIVVLYDDGLWKQFEDTWTPDQPETDPEIVPPTGLHQPIRGFGKLWRENTEVRERIGWGVAREFGYEATWQEQIQESVPAVVYIRTLDYRVIRVDGWGMGSGAWRFVTP